MAEKLISCNWVDPRRTRQAQQRCWLGMRHRCLPRPGVLCLQEQAPQQPHAQAGVFHWGCFARSLWGLHVVFYVLMVLLPDLPPAHLALSGALGHWDPKRWPRPPVSACSSPVWEKSCSKCFFWTRPDPQEELPSSLTTPCVPLCDPHSSCSLCRAVPPGPETPQPCGDAAESRGMAEDTCTQRSLCVWISFFCRCYLP